MALIECSECQNEGSDKAAARPKCGHPGGYYHNQTVDVSYLIIKFGLLVKLMIRTVFAAIPAAMFCSAVNADSISRTISPAQDQRIQYDSASASQKRFNFFGSAASLKQNGDWSIDGRVSHKGMLCANYEVGVRFGTGTGARGCVDVEWITTDEFVSSQSLCNNAAKSFSGVSHDEALATNFVKITCAERIIRCIGNCK